MQRCHSVRVLLAPKKERLDRLELVRHLQEGEDPREYSLAVAPCRLVAGRAEDCQIILDDPHVSQQHLEFVRDLDGVSVADMDSKNGFELNGKPTRSRRLRHGDQIKLGSASRLEFVEPADEAMGKLCKQADSEVSRPEVPPNTATVEELAAATSPPPAALAPSVSWTMAIPSAPAPGARLATPS